MSGSHPVLPRYIETGERNTRCANASKEPADTYPHMYTHTPRERACCVSHPDTRGPPGCTAPRARPCSACAQLSTRRHAHVRSLCTSTHPRLLRTHSERELLPLGLARCLGAHTYLKSRELLAHARGFIILHRPPPQTHTYSLRRVRLWRYLCVFIYLYYIYYVYFFPSLHAYICDKEFFSHTRSSVDGYIHTCIYTYPYMYTETTRNALCMHIHLNL